VKKQKNSQTQRFRFKRRWVKRGRDTVIISLLLATFTMACAERKEYSYNMALLTNIREWAIYCEQNKNIGDCKVFGEAPILHPPINRK
jgi:hypothetical protein